MNQHNITLLRQLKLTGMAQALLQQLEQPGTYQALSFEERLQLLIDHEWLITSFRSLNNIMPIRFFLPAFTSTYFYSF